MTRATLQQERSRATRKAIMTAAETLWRDQGFDAVSVEDVCQRAEVAKGSFYFYFPKKEHLLVMLVFARMTPREHEVRSLIESDIGTVDLCGEIAAMMAARALALDKGLVQRGVEASFQHYREISKLGGGDRDLRWFLQPVFARGVARREVQAAWEDHTIATAMGWALLQGILFWASGAIADEDLAANLRQRAELLANGAATKRRMSMRVKTGSPNRAVPKTA